MGLTGKERVLVALDHKEPDRVPLDLGGSFVTAINVQVYKNLRRALGLPEKYGLLREQTQSVAVDEDVRQLLGIDTIGLYERPPRPELERPRSDGSLVSEWGVVYKKVNGLYTPVKHPLAQATLADLDQYNWPDPLAPARFAGLEEEAFALRKSDYAVVGNLGWTEVFGMAWYLRGFENFMVDLIARKEFAHALLRRITDHQKARYLKFLEIVGNVIDIILFADDLGGQHGLFISPSTYRKMIKPYHAEIIQAIRSKTRARIMFHSCGSVTPLLDDFVELGVDILNPVQVSAKGMDTLALKRRYGKRLSFWGAVDTQRILPHDTPEGVRGEVQRRISHLASGGGYVVAPVHVVQADVPSENVIAMCQAVWKSGKE